MKKNSKIIRYFDAIVTIISVWNKHGMRSLAMVEKDNNDSQSTGDDTLGRTKSALALSDYRRFLSGIQSNDDEDDGGSEIGELKPEASEEYEHRLLRRQEEEQYGKHVREARDPSDVPDQDHEQGFGQGMKTHPLLAHLPLGTDAPMERINAVENDAARMQLKRDYENKLRAKNTSMPTPRAF